MFNPTWWDPEIDKAVENNNDLPQRRKRTEGVQRLDRYVRIINMFIWGAEKFGEKIKVI